MGVEKRKASNDRRSNDHRRRSEDRGGEDRRGEGRSSVDRRGGSTAFLLAQVGAEAARQFSERLSVLGLVPADAGMLRRISYDPGVSQQALAAHLGVMPSRMVALVDDLEAKGIVMRRRNPMDRRNYELILTERGRELMEQIARIAAEHDQNFCAPLNPEEKAQLSEFLRRLGEAKGLTPGVHPGYRTLGRRKKSATRAREESSEI